MFRTEMFESSKIGKSFMTPHKIYDYMKIFEIAKRERSDLSDVELTFELHEFLGRNMDHMIIMWPEDQYADKTF